MKYLTTKIAVIGGSGKAGKYLVRQLVDGGFDIKVLIRNPERLTIRHPSVEMIVGDATDFHCVRSLVDGADAIISTLGLGVPPSAPEIFSVVTTNVIRAMRKTGVRRYIAIAGLNVDASTDMKSEKTQQATEWMYANFPKSTADRQLEYELLQASSLDWTLVRLPLIDQTQVRHEVLVSLDDCPGEEISATSLAEFLIHQLADATYVGKAPFIANARDES